MRKNKGVTLVALVVTVVVMAILAGTAVYNGTKAIEKANKQQFISELEIVQAKVNTIYEKMQNNEQEANYYNSIGRIIDSLEQSKLTLAIGKTPSNGVAYTTREDGFQYFEASDLEKIGVSNIKRAILINFNTREVCSYTGIEIEGTTYYKLSDFGYSAWNVEYSGNGTDSPAFEININKLEDNKWKMSVQNIVTSNDIDIDNVAYKISNDTNWKITNNLEFEVTSPGLYDVKLTDKAGNSTIIKEYIYVDNGLILYLDGENNVGSNSHSEIANTWYDLSGNKNNGTIRGATWKENSLYFDGTDDYVSPSKMNYSNISMEAVVSYGEISSGEMSIIGNLENGGYGLLKSSSSTTNGFQVNIDGADSVAQSTQNIQTDKRYYLSGNYDGNTINLFENAQKYSTTKTGTITTTQNDTVMMIGANPSGSNSDGAYFKGNIYCVRVYNRALTDEEIQINYSIDKYRFNIE